MPNQRPLANKIRIIAGSHRGRRIPILDRPGLRPSPERVRETVFNWLQNEIAGAAVFDAFAGSGAMGLEALSRGAGSALFCDNDSQILAAIRNCLQEWHIGHARTLQSDALTLSNSPTRYDLIFLDPPFDANLHQAAIDKFAGEAWLKPYGKIYVESAEKLENLRLKTGWQWLKSGRAGQVYFGLLGRSDD